MSNTELVEYGPTYGIQLIERMPLGGGMFQAMPSADDLRKCTKNNQRVAAGYEVLLANYRKQLDETERLKQVIRSVIAGDWSPTTLQEAIGDLA